MLLSHRADGPISHPQFCPVGGFSLTTVFQDSVSLSLVCIYANQNSFVNQAVSFLFLPAGYKGPHCGTIGVRGSNDATAVTWGSGPLASTAHLCSLTLLVTDP